MEKTKGLFAFIGAIVGVLLLRRLAVGSSVPRPIEGTLSCSWGPIGEYKDVSAFIYFGRWEPKGSYTAYAHIESSEGSKDLPLPDNPIYELGFVTVFTALTDRQTLWVAYGAPIKVSKYIIGRDSLTLVSTVEFGDIDSRLRGLIRLKSGKVLVMWSQQLTGCPVGYAYTDSLGTWHEPGYIEQGGHRAIKACVCQHPDNSIWWFSSADGWNGLKAIRLLESGDNISVDFVNPDFIALEDYPDEPEMRPCGELPFVTAVADPSTNSILLAFQNGNWQVFSTDPFCKGANLSVLSVKTNGAKQLELALPVWVERTQPFCLGIDKDNKIRLSYAQLDEVELTANDLYINNEPLGELAGGDPPKAGICFVNSSKYVIGNMSDGYIRFFRI